MNTNVRYIYSYSYEIIDKEVDKNYYYYNMILPKILNIMIIHC